MAADSLQERLDTVSSIYAIADVSVAELIDLYFDDDTTTAGPSDESVVQSARIREHSSIPGDSEASDQDDPVLVRNQSTVRGQSFKQKRREKITQEKADASVSAGPWEFVGTEQGVDIFQKKTNECEHQIMKGVKDVDIPIDGFRELIDDSIALGGPGWDPLFVEGKVLERLDRRTRVLWFKFAAKLCLLEKKRDFCVVNHWFDKRTPSGDIESIVFVCRSVNYDSCPHDPVYQRGELFTTGYVFTPLDISRSRVTYIVNLDLKHEMTQLADFMRRRVIDVIRRKQPLNALYIEDYYKQNIANKSA